MALYKMCSSHWDRHTWANCPGVSNKETDCLEVFVKNPKAISTAPDMPFCFRIYQANNFMIEWTTCR